MNDAGLVLIQTRYALLATLRTPRAMLFGSSKLTVQRPWSSTFAGTRAASAPSTRAIAVTFAPTGSPPSARFVSSVAVTLSPGP